ncbi:ricin B lectin [Peniophora sp. CONT]|nr:ricin B lectin [Peniophora sp. CONT]
MNQLFSAIVYAAILVTSTVAQSVPAGSIVQIHSAQNNLCLGAVAGTQQSEILLEPCSSDLTTFILTAGTSTAATQIELVGNATGQPALCITAAQSQAGNTPVILQACQDDPFSRWRFEAGKGTGEIVSTASTNGQFCLTAVGSNQGDPVEFRSCTGAANQEWTTVVQ